MTKPLVSVILPTHNRAESITKAIGSVVLQTYENFEIIVVDDCSTDQTPEVLHKLAKEDKRIKIITNDKNLRLVRSLNKGIIFSSGKYIARIDDDDAWSNKEKLEKQVNFLEKNRDYVAVVGMKLSFLMTHGLNKQRMDRGTLLGVAKNY